MQGSSWIALFNRIPTKYHDSLALATTTGSEIVVQCLLRLEENFLMLRGRMAGTTDAGRVVVLPWSQITHVAFTRRMSEPEVQGMFGELMEAPANANAPKKDEASDDTPRELPDEHDSEEAEMIASQGAATVMKTAASMPSDPAASKEKPKQVSKSMLLARLRQRLADQGHNLP